MPAKTPDDTYAQIESIGVKKASLSPLETLVRGFYAGAYIAFGGLNALIVGGAIPPEYVRRFPSARSRYGGLGPLLFGAVFPLGLWMVVWTGSELWTGNTMFMIPATVKRIIHWKMLLKNWIASWLGNLIGSLFVAVVLVWLGGIAPAGTAAGDKAVAAAIGKTDLPSMGKIFVKAIGCNWLVCQALFGAVAAGDSMSGKLMAMWFPIQAFVTIGFEHSIANMFFIPLGLLNGATTQNANANIGTFAINLLVVSAGNFVGGSIFVALAHTWMHGRKPKPMTDLPTPGLPPLGE